MSYTVETLDNLQKKKTGYIYWKQPIVLSLDHVTRNSDNKTQNKHFWLEWTKIKCTELIGLATAVMHSNLFKYERLR